VVGRRPERRLHELDLGAPAPGDEAVDHEEEADGHDHHGDRRAVLHRPDQQQLDDGADGEGDRQREEERLPVRQSVPRQLEGDVRRRHRELTLREVDHFGCAVDQHERECEAAEDRAFGEAGDGLLREDAADEAADDEEDGDRGEADQHGRRDVRSDSAPYH
jgi:hypothetical protein